MRPIDIAIYVILGIAALALVWLVANRQRKTSGTADLIATWVATWLLVFLVSGGLMMFGVVVIFFALGQPAAQVGLVVLAAVLVIEPFALAGIVFRRRRIAAH